MIPDVMARAVITFCWILERGHFGATKKYMYTVIVSGHFIIDNSYICIILQGLFFLAYICRKIAFCSIKPSCYLLLDKKNIHMQTARLR